MRVPSIRQKVQNQICKSRTSETQKRFPEETTMLDFRKINKIETYGVKKKNKTFQNLYSFVFSYEVGIIHTLP